MINSQLAQLYNHSTSFVKGALLLVLILGLSPIAAAADSGNRTGDGMSPAPITININTADAQSLAEGLKGIGPSKAAEIVRYREAYGPFASVDELSEVKGVGKSTIDKNRNVLILE